MKHSLKKFAEGDLSNLIGRVEIHGLLQMDSKILNKLEFFFENNLDIYKRLYNASDFLTM
ncbi:MAG TPA: hypothetical protein VMU83_11415 [Hanamia sp.]|nr:hypothetical protein [Hanamia sp.]